MNAETTKALARTFYTIRVLATTRDSLPKTPLSKTQPENRVHYPALDGVRALALCLVFGQHYAALPWGYTGVDLFFVLSGFLITGVLFDSIDRPDRVRTFFIRRSLRIFPLYYGLFAVLLLLTPLLHLQWNRYWLVWPAYLGNIIRFVRPYSTSPLYLSAANGWLQYGSGGKSFYLGHFWSLSLEEQFYLAWPWVVFWLRDRRKLLWLCAAVVVSWPFVRYLTMKLLPIRYTVLELPYSFTPLRIDALLLGALLALLMRGAHRGAILNICRWCFSLAVPCVLAYLLFTVHPGRTYSYPEGRLIWVQSVIDLLYTALIGAALLPGTVVYRICTVRWLRRLGQISYGAYIFHDIPHVFYGIASYRLSQHVHLMARAPQLSLMLMAATCTLVLATLSYRYIEAPILALKERWAPSRI